MKKHIILENQRGLHIRNGLIVGEVGPGVYHSFKYANTDYVIFSQTPQFYVALNSFVTSDLANVYVEVPVNIYTHNIKQHFLSGVTMQEAVVRALSKHIQAQVSNKSFPEVLEAQPEVDATAVNELLADFGLEISVEGAVGLRVPRNLQNALDAQEVARQRAKAELEEARGRTAVLRHYANTAKMTKDNPDLLRLLLGQKAKSVNVAFDAHK